LRSKPKKCPQCGEKNNPSFEKCWKCGAELDKTQAKETDVGEYKLSGKDVSRGAWVTVKAAWKGLMALDKFLSKPVAIVLGIIVAIALSPILLLLVIFDAIGKASRNS